MINNKKRITAGITATLATLAMTAVNADELISTASEQSNLNVTIYNSNVALIKDTRKVQLPPGVNDLAFKDVSASIQAETAILKGDKVVLLEQNFEYDLLSPGALLKKYVGKTVTVVTTNPATGEVSKAVAKVLADNDGVMLKIDDKILQLNDNMSIVYDNIPKNLRDKPTLTMRLDNQGTKEQQLELSYLSGNLNWKADYVANLVDDNTLNLKGWVTLINDSGTSYQNAKLQLVAGDIHRASHPMPLEDLSMVKRKFAAYGANAAPAMQEESLFEYHLYSLALPTTIKNKQQKQVSLLEATNVPYKKQLVVVAKDNYGWRWWGDDAEYQEQTVNANIVIENKKANRLGLPIPAGIVRGYLNDKQGNMQFIGEDRIKHTPENEKITLKLGESFDVTVKRKQTNFHQQHIAIENAVKTTRKKEVTATYEVLFKNAKETEALVEYKDIFYGDWEIVKQSLPSDKINSRQNVWQVSVPPKGETALTYTVKSVY